MILKNKVLNIVFGFQQSPFGWIISAETEAGVCFVGLGNLKEKLIHELRVNFPNAEMSHNDKKLKLSMTPLSERLKGQRSDGKIPLDIMGTPFQKSVWRALIEIPPQTTLSYSELALKIKKPKAQRAVGRACGQNPLSLIIPCHRIVGADRTLTGYRWGIEKKRLILDWEKSKTNLILNIDWIRQSDFD